MVLAAAAAEWALESTLSRLIIKGARQDGTREVDALVNVEGDNVKANGTAFTRLIIDLLENTSDGWSLQGFDDGDTSGRAANLGLPRELTGSYLVAPGPASEVFQQNGYHAVLYHGPSDSYRFHSTENVPGGALWSGSENVPAALLRECSRKPRPGVRPSFAMMYSCMSVDFREEMKP